MNKTAPFDRFANRHIGISEQELPEMLSAIGVSSLDQLIDETVPPAIRMNRELNLPEAITEHELLEDLRRTGAMNRLCKSYIGMGYSGTITPSVILRNVFQNPGWYTQYTPYQAEISQGRLEALLNFQTMVSDLTGLPIANASLLDEGTAAAEAMHMFYGIKNKRNKGDAMNEFLVSDKVLPQTIDVLKTRARPLDIEIIVTDWRSFEFTDKTFGLLLQYPDREGTVEDYRALVEKARAQEVYVTVATDLLSLALLAPPGEWGADAAVGNSQRFGIPMGYGGPHAAFFATREEHKRQIPGRIIGVSVDTHGKKAYRMALQTREQHIRREKATSNICTAQALLAVMASMYAVYHGPKGIKAIAERTHTLAQILERHLKAMGYNQANAHYFDTLRLEMDGKMVETVRRTALAHETNFFYEDNAVQVSLDETVGMKELEAILAIFAEAKGTSFSLNGAEPASHQIPEALQRQTPFLEHIIFNSFHTETNMMRYLKQLENRDLSLVHSMIPLGSCTMKLNAATELMPVSWAAFANLHPFVPADQAKGYYKIFEELEQWLSEITGFAACSLQPNSGAQGEYTGLMVIRAYHESRGETHRNVALIPESAHGTNPASAVMAGMQVVVVKCDEQGDIDVDDLRAKAENHKDKLAALMVTY
ncbi:MAG: aminomethyl-transferring glycine dehydrogenase, partial [Phaeodactylibacter sp.]|nr:aminomethyl-transferring glycine dehydrogenase [Phaeodactylibacter sp.]